MFQAGVLSNNADIVGSQLRGQPTEGALFVLSRKTGMQQDPRRLWERVEEVPFNSDTKWMSVLCKQKYRVRSCAPYPPPPPPHPVRLLCEHVVLC